MPVGREKTMKEKEKEKGKEKDCKWGMGRWGQAFSGHYEGLRKLYPARPRAFE